MLNAIHGPDGHGRGVAADPFHWKPRPLRAALAYELATEWHKKNPPLLA